MLQNLLPPRNQSLREYYNWWFPRYFSFLWFLVVSESAAKSKYTPKYMLIPAYSCLNAVTRVLPFFEIFINVLNARKSQKSIFFLSIILLAEKFRSYTVPTYSALCIQIFQVKKKGNVKWPYYQNINADL